MTRMTGATGWSAPQEWTGRDDGPGAAHVRWHTSVETTTPERLTERVAPPGVVLVGFASDEGVRRNQGRTGAAEAPAALRGALSSLAVHRSGLNGAGGGNRAEPWRVYDVGDVVVDPQDQDLEAGQQALGEILTAAQRGGHLTVALGGGHEITYASYLGLAGARSAERRETGGTERTLGVLNLDAHFDLRVEERATSGTGFSQIADDERAAGRAMHYAVLGISRPSNTGYLFDRADSLGVRYLEDERCRIDQLGAVQEWVADFLDSVDDLYLTIDLDVLPAAVAPGVSAPAALGVSAEVIHAVVAQCAASGLLRHLDVAELNPRFDVDSRTARIAARLISTAVGAAG